MWLVEQTVFQHCCEQGVKRFRGYLLSHGINVFILDQQKVMLRRSDFYPDSYIEGLVDNQVIGAIVPQQGWPVNEQCKRS